MMRDGFSLCELIYKRRIGLAANVNSKYDDGRIGWRKWLFIGSDSLAPGSPWIFDENGGLLFGPYSTSYDSDLRGR